MDFTKVTDEDLTLLKNSLRIDGNDDDLILKKAIITARKNIVGEIGNTISTFYDNNDEFEWTTTLLASHYYRNRSATADTQKFTTPLAYNDLILALKENYLIAVNNEVTSDG
ncbi:hypothetical protein HFM82_14655 [Lactobacillus plantarum]|uniref:head-tail connector protein n=1 Tax=Lactiplantibacillus plantarum TaxID=1590 RepID=UPI00143D2C04|nr:head-tail connector protein [Lactiplantibacillus plantarum]MBE1727404.1 phage head-tail connector protein [Lactiplantibacillus plantarum]NKI39447.1 hypothetical protein [Lactiplantibacillus plantarum]